MMYTLWIIIGGYLLGSILFGKIFLNLLMDQYEYRGKIIKSVRFDYFPYLVKDTKKWTMEVLNEVCPQAEEWQIRKELYALEVDEEVLWRPFCSTVFE